MRDPFENPFLAADAARHAIWEMLVPRDIGAFLSVDWSMVEEDFLKDGFIGRDARHETNPDSWLLAFPTLEAYRDEWLRQAREFAGQDFAEGPQTAIFRATMLEDIEIAGETALVRKKFDGSIKIADGGVDILRWQTLYYCRRDDGRWKISGFTGYLPNPMT